MNCIGKPRTQHGQDNIGRCGHATNRWAATTAVAILRSFNHKFAQIKAAGIDYVLLDDTNGIWNDNGEIEKNAKSIFDTDDQLPADQRTPLAFVLGTWE
jgi:hypothetical protein